MEGQSQRAVNPLNETKEADVTMVPVSPSNQTMLNQSMASSSGSPLQRSMQSTLADELRDTIQGAVQGAVGTVLKSAVDELKAEIAKRDVQSAALGEQMTELTKAVNVLQDANKQSMVDPQKLFDLVDKNNDGIISLEEFKEACVSGKLSEAVKAPTAREAAMTKQFEDFREQTKEDLVRLEESAKAVLESSAHMKSSLFKEQ